MSTLRLPHLLLDPITIAPGSWADYARLAGHHYRLGHPRSFDRVLAAMHGGNVVGVLVVSRPVLNAGWRAKAWGDRYSPPTSKREIAARLNQEVRTISRVIVEPRYRGLGVARRLVQAYLANPATRRTEAIAGMGRWCPFFERAGMRRVEFAPAKRDEALARVIRRTGLKAWMLADLSVASRVLESNAHVRAGVARWASASRGTRGHALSPQLLVLAASTIASPPIAYVAERKVRATENAAAASSVQAGAKSHPRPKALTPVAGGEAKRHPRRNGDVKPQPERLLVDRNVDPFRVDRDVMSESGGGARRLASPPATHDTALRAEGNLAGR